jgi:1-acyl-sn-glycerol-3-phosphate acyltransferase
MTGSELTTSKSGHSTHSVESQVVPWVKKIVHPVARYLLLPTMFREIKVIGKEYIPYSGAVILAPTHRTRWDTFITSYAVGPYVTGRNSRFMVSVNETQGIQGWFVRRLGGFAIDPDKPGIASIRHSVELLQNGEMLTIFPEGNLFRDGKLHPLKEGLSRIAMQAVSLKPDLDLKIIPINLDYEHPSVQFRDRVSIELGKPLQVNDYQQFSSKTGAKKLHTDLTHALAELIESAR